MTDTDPKVEGIRIELLRRMPDWRKIQMVAQLNETIKTLALRGLRQRHPDASEGELRRLLADLILGETLAMEVYGPNPKSQEALMTNEPVQVTLLVIHALENPEIPGKGKSMGRANNIKAADYRRFIG
ncbi:MAG: hypothetical protein FIB03_00290 [Anaerolineae bacterium]|nr:hypothetical protein [Anaerolineae bacterium]